ncbi:hypothetical protein DPMN_182588 [Dreissena polymorpha]|uniref:Uncharacterized protein n=2 Tax=Dreissena polymorpha TaxID=45954 RepID=A0A9D4I2S0_DREPO|nr:hypothetical protein DPMN_182588 [Dreissena polymorpha]
MWGDVLLSSEETCGVLSHTYVSALRSEILSHDMSNIEIRMESGSKELFEILRDSSIGILDMRTAYCASFASNILHTLNTLTTLNLCGTYTGRCDLKLPASFQRIRLQDVEWSTEWLCSLLITLFSLDYPVKCEMRDDVFLSSGDVSHTHVSDLRSEILSLDLSNIEIIVTNGSKELFNLLRDTSIGSLLIAAEDYCSLGTFMLTQLNKLKQINLVGTYLTRFDYDLPLSLELMILYECKYSLESLYTILIKLSSIKHNVKLDVSNCSVISGQEACPPSSKDNLLKWEYSKSVKTGVNERLYTNVSDLQSRMMAINMSNIELRILNFQKEQFEILRCTNIKSVHLTAFDDVSLTFVTQNTLPAFKEIRLQGTYLTGFYHKLPPTLQYMILEKGYCSSDWLYSLMIQLSKIGHLVEVLLNEYQVLQRRESIRTDSEPPMRGADLSNVKLNVLKDCPGFYETLPTIHITSLIMTKIEHADMLSQTLPLLTHLQKLRICLEKCDMEIKLPECIKYLFIIYKTWSPPSLQHFVHNMSIIKHSLQCKLLFRVAENEHDYTRIKQEYSELKSVDVQKFEVINKRGSVRGAAAFTLSATADDDDDDDDRRLLSSEGLFVDSKPWIHYGKVRLNISCQDKSGCSS